MNLSGSAILQRANVSTQMYFLSLVGIWLGLPSHSRTRFSKTFAFWINGIFILRPGSVIESPMGRPNCVMTICCVMSTT